MKSLTPNFFVENVAQTMEFYHQLGFEVRMKVPEEGEPVWVMMGNGEVNMMFQSMKSLQNELPEISRQAGGALLFYLQVSGIRDWHLRCENMGVVFKGLEKTFYGATEFSIKDCNGYVLTFAEDEI